MKNGLDEQYIDLLKDILENGVEKNTRSGKVLSVFGRSIRYKFKDGKFPLLTSKKMYTKGIITELLWFLRGETNIRPLVLGDCHIWNGDALKRLNKYIDDQNNKFGFEHPYLDYQPKAIFCNESFINSIKNDLDFAEKWGELGPIYGHGWRNWGGKSNNDVTNKGIDQIQNLINDLKNNPDSRRMVVSAWNPSDIDSAVLPPCHYGFQCYTRELTEKERMDYWFKIHKPNRDVCDYLDNSDISEQHKYFDEVGIPKRAISLMWNQRSIDTPLGLPFNIASYGFLLCLFGYLTNMIPDELIGNLGDTHIYLNQLDGVKEQINRPYHDLPTLHINGEFWLPNFDDPKVKEIGCSNTPGSFSNNFDELIKGINVEDFIIENYKSEPTIKFPLSN